MPLEFLADRSIGKRVVASLRGAGELVHTLADVFGEDVSQRVEDDSWIARAGSQGWAALTKDKRIRHVTTEREAVGLHGVVLFALANANLGLAEMAGAFLTAMPRIHEICAGAAWRIHLGGAARWSGGADLAYD